MGPGETSSEDQKTPGGPLSQGRVGQEGHCLQVGEPGEAAARVVGMAAAAWPGEMLSPTLCCVAVIKLLPFVMVPRGGVKRLLIKTDVSEVAPPEPFQPWNCERRHRGAQSLRPEPRQHRGEHPAPHRAFAGRSPPRRRPGGCWGWVGGEVAPRMLRAGCEAGGALGRSDPKGCGGWKAMGRGETRQQLIIKIHESC